MIWVRSSRCCHTSSCVEVAIVAAVDDIEWHKSSKSSTDITCVEVAWHKSSLSGPWTDNCVDVAGTDTQILVRDSKDQDGPVLRFDFDEWEAFIGGIKLGEFDIKRPTEV